MEPRLLVVLEGDQAEQQLLELGGHTSTTECTDHVIRRVKSKLEVWASLA